MFAYLLLALIAACAAVPRYPCLYNCYNDHEEFFNVNQFMDGLSDTMRQVDQAVNIAKKLASSQGIVNGEYQVVIPLQGFQRSDIVVDARGGSLVVHATRWNEVGGQNNHLDIKTLPSYVDPNGKWTYYNGLLKIYFPLKPGMNLSEQDANGNVNNISILNSGTVYERPGQVPYRRPVTTRPVYEPSYDNQQPYDESPRNTYGRQTTASPLNEARYDNQKPYDESRSNTYGQQTTASPVPEGSYDNQQPYYDSRRTKNLRQTTASPVDEGRYDNEQQYSESPRKHDIQYDNPPRYNLRSRH